MIRMFSDNYVCLVIHMVSDTYVYWYVCLAILSLLILSILMLSDTKSIDKYVCLVIRMFRDTYV